MGMALTNYAKYGTDDARVEAFCKQNDIAIGSEDYLNVRQVIKWLSMNPSECGLLACPFCGGRCELKHQNDSYFVVCLNHLCRYVSGQKNTEEIARNGHNSVAYSVVAKD